MIKQNKYIFAILTFICVNIYAQDSTNNFDNNGERHGIWRKNFNNTSLLRYQGQFEHGKEVGLFKFYQLVDNKQSVLSATKLFNVENSLAKTTFFTSKGKVISEGLMDGKKFVGKWVYYHHKSNTVMTEEFYNTLGVLEGEKRVYYDNGQIAEKISYINGKRAGLSVWYSEEGMIIKEFNYVDDVLHGNSKYYDNQGQLLVEGHYKNGKKHGVWRYFENGKLIEEKDFTYVSKAKE